MRSHAKQLISILVLAAALSGASTASAAAATGGGSAKRRVAVLPLKNLGVDEDVASSLVGFLRAEVANLPGVALVDLSKVWPPLGADCKGEPKCLSAAARKVLADEVIHGTVAGVGDAYSIDLKRVVTKESREDGRVTEMLSGDRELLIDGVRGAAYKLLLPEQYVGQIQVELREQGAEILVDGKSAGKSPLKKPIANLAPGKHALKIVKQGFADFDKWVDVKFARVSVVRIDLENSAITGVMYESGNKPDKPEAPAAAVSSPAEPPPFYRTGKAAIVLGATGVGLVAVGSIFGVLAASNQKTVNDAQIYPGGPVPLAKSAETKAALDALHWQALTADILWAAGGVAVLGAGAIWFTRPDEPAPAATLRVAPTAGGMAFSLSGTF